MIFFRIFNGSKMKIFVLNYLFLKWNKFIIFMKQCEGFAIMLTGNCRLLFLYKFLTY